MENISVPVRTEISNLVGVSLSGLAGDRDSARLVNQFAGRLVAAAAEPKRSFNSSLPPRD
ncbi:hypothetical protein [Actinocorallia populi]|uniref:hypothetical protein n=1 Tax=Actinocorallia populi TaxID=2079200 RepID=UPI00130081B0|nr:hypothetical protein [Actinocorallia populi]